MNPIPKPSKPDRSPVEKAVDALLKQVSEVNAGTRDDGPLTKAWREYEAQLKYSQQGITLLQGRQTVGISWDEQHTMDKSELERQLEDSLWALQQGTDQATPEVIRQHLPHFEGSTQRIRRVYSKSVLILCPCRVQLAFLRCVFIEPDGGQCEEEVPSVEGGYATCVTHRTHDPATGRPWRSGSRFYRCDFVLGGTQCDGLATTVSTDGRHWCRKAGHSA